MKNLETNKIAAAIFMAGLIALGSGKIADFLYHPVKSPEKRGFAVEVAEDTNVAGSAAPAEEEVVDVAAVMAAADATAGAAVFKKCASCHSTDSGKNGVGPSLAKVVNAPKCHVSDYACSDALKAKGGTWTEDELFHFLKNPKKFIPGTKMSFAGLKAAKDKADVIAFLKTK